VTTHSDEPAPLPNVPHDPEPGAPVLGGVPAGLSPEVAQGLGNLLAMAVKGASSMGDHPACERRPWPGDNVCGAVLLEATDAAGGKHVHYCHTDLDAHDVDTEHVCVCGVDWAERTDGVAEVVGPNETIVRPAS
jgi:hypothetical protein